jgi:hypothetical protein
MLEVKGVRRSVRHAGLGRASRRYWISLGSGLYCRWRVVQRNADLLIRTRTFTPLLAFFVGVDQNRRQRTGLCYELAKVTIAYFTMWP